MITINMLTQFIVTYFSIFIENKRKGKTFGTILILGSLLFLQGTRKLAMNMTLEVLLTPGRIKTISI